MSWKTSRFMADATASGRATPSPGWQFTAVDAAFDGQREAAIRERAAGLTLIRPRFRNVPTAISIEEDSHDELWVKDGRFEDISGPAVMVSLEDNPRTEINFEDVVCRRVPVFAAFRESGRKMSRARRDLRSEDLLARSALSPISAPRRRCRMCSRRRR